MAERMGHYVWLLDSAGLPAVADEDWPAETRHSGRFPRKIRDLKSESDGCVPHALPKVAAPPAPIAFPD
jgi:hypothetical protein